MNQNFPQLHKEFPDFGQLDVTLPFDFVESSWHNNGCPSFEGYFNQDENRGGDDGRVTIWVDYADKSRRIDPEAPRFMAETRESGDTQIAKLESDDWNEILKFARIEIMKGELVRNVQSGYVPADVPNYGELDNHLDNNCVGGFCVDDAFPEGWNAEGHMTDEFMEFHQACIEEVDKWIISGGLQIYSAKTTRLKP